MVQQIAARITGLPAEAIKVHITYLGGGFGRRADTDWPREAIQISHRVGAPVKLMWTREDDLQFGYYRPASYSRLIAGLDNQGRLVAWSNQIVGPSAQGHWNPARITNGLSSAIKGAFDLPYDIGNIEVRYLMANTPVPPDAWRSVAHSQHAFSSECFLDEVAAASGTDPLELRLRLLSNGKTTPEFKVDGESYVIDTKRLRRTLEVAAENAGWGSKSGSGRSHGIACHFCFGTYVAHVAEVSIGEDGTPRVHRVTCAVDCGQVVNPDTVEAQMQGAIVFGLTAGLYGQITVSEGRVQQSNFHDYRMLRINETPEMDVHIIPSTEPPGGIGEPGVPPIIPAVANALSAATGQRIRRLPIQT